MLFKCIKIFFPEKKDLKKCASTHINFSDPLPETHLFFFLFGQMSLAQLSQLCNTKEIQVRTNFLNFIQDGILQISQTTEKKNPLNYDKCSKISNTFCT